MSHATSKLPGNSIVHSEASPLAQLSDSMIASSSQPKSTVPAIDFNLFRSNSVYSVESTQSLDDDEEESPATPKANRTQYFDHSNPSHPPEAITPKRSFVVTSRTPTIQSPPVPAFQLRPVPGRRDRSASNAEAIPRQASVPLAPDYVDTSTDWHSIHGEQGSEWGEDEVDFEWLDTDGAPEARNGDGQPKSMSPSKRLRKLAIGEGRRLKKPLVFPKRAAPPPPPVPPTPIPVQINHPSNRILRNHNSQPQVGEVYRQEPRLKVTPTLVPMKDGPSDKPRLHTNHNSVAYSFYDLDGSPSTPTGQPADVVFPHGKYTRVRASTLDRPSNVERDRAASLDERRKMDAERSPQEFIQEAIEARGKGDLAKSAWLFMNAAECGSATGRMYWGLSLRHGWGVARDEKRAFAELLQACDATVADGSLNASLIGLPQAQKTAISRDLCLGLFEIANCFLEGVGTKKAPGVALAYLRMAGNMGDLAAQEQLGFLLSKGQNGIKKDMREAAFWYRAAIAQGSTNTFGLAWIWKDKYM